MLLDDIAHPSWPWTSESLAIARHKPNFYIDLSGWAPKYFPPELVSQVNSVIPEVRPKIMLTNAGKLFGVKDALP